MFHPVLRTRGRLLVYLAAWAGLGTLLALAVTSAGGVGFGSALLFALPLLLLLGFQSLGSWYLVRALPTESTPAPRLLASWMAAALLSVGVWTLLGLVWAAFLLERAGAGLDARREILLRSAPLLGAVGLLGFLVAVLAHYLLEAAERSRSAERRTLELQVHARDAELRALKAQLDPHFLFNSLNSVAALIGTDARAARRMCFLMAGFFRKSLALGRREAIPLGEEIFLAETFLAIEEVRFGERLRTSFEVDEEALTLAVPPLLLQPLVENAVHHGIAHLVDGGVVRIAARRAGDGLVVEVENPCDSERPPSRGAGVGLANVRARLAAAYAHRGVLEVEVDPERFRARLLLPAEPAVI
jgi:hypothetical protein